MTKVFDEEVKRVFVEEGEEEKRTWRITEAGKKMKVRVIYRVPEGKQLKLDYKAIVLAPNVEVEMLASGVVEGRKELSMTVDFRRGAHGGRAVVKDDVILEGGAAQNVSRPIILSAEKDVVGQHGAAVGRIDKKMYEYLSTRGITREKVRELLIRAKLREGGGVENE